MQQTFSNSCLEKKKKFQKWIRDKVDYSQEEKKKPYTFLDETSFRDCLLPPLSSEPKMLHSLFMNSVIDHDMESDLKGAGILNWCPQAIKLHAISVPRDGNCLLHSASVAIWGTEDNKSTLRDLMLMTIKHDYNNSYKTRWWQQRLRDLQSLGGNAPEMIDQEWDDVIRSISNLGSSALSTAVPHRFLESIHIYVLANILRRPIIVLTDNVARSLTGRSLQENHICGLYLPLEWHPQDCCKTPIIIGYSYSHFCPLISKAGMQEPLREILSSFPLVDRDLGVLPVRFLTEQEEREAWGLVQAYLNITELAVEGKDHTKTRVPFAQLEFKTWPSDVNLFHDHLKIVEQNYRESLGVGAVNEGAKGKVQLPASGVTPAQHHQNPFYQIQLNSQTELAPVRGTTDRVGQPRPAGGQGGKVSGGVTSQTSAENQRNAQKCRSENCTKLGNPGQGNLCDDCFRNLTIAESGAELVSMQEGERHFYVLKKNEAQATGVTKGDEMENFLRSEVELTNPQDHMVVPTAPPPSHIELESFSEPPSMMTERCKNRNCGYRSSRQTYPYCHECHDIEQRRKLAEQALAVRTAPSANAGNLISDYERRENLAYPEGSAGMNVLNPSGQSTPAGSFSGSISHSNTEMAWHSKSRDNISNPDMEVKIRNDISQIGSYGQQTFEGAHKSVRATEGGLDQRHPPQSEEAFAETGTKNMNSDVVVSEEPSCEMKCVSPYCKNIVQQHEQLCQKCKDVLKRVSEQKQAHEESRKQVTTKIMSAGKEIEDQRAKENYLKAKVRPPSGDQRQEPSRAVQAQRGKACATPNCPNYGDPSMNDMCSSCYFRSNPMKKAHTSPLASKKKDPAAESPKFSRSERITQPVEDLQQLRSSYQTAEAGYNSTRGQYVTSHMPSTKHRPGAETHAARTSSPATVGSQYVYSLPASDPDQFSSFAPTSSQYYAPPTSASFTHLSPNSLMVTSKTSVTPLSENFPQNLQSSSRPYTPEADREFTAKFQGIEERVRNASKCVMDRCENFGNIQKNGYCNACYNVYKQQLERERELLEYGEDVPDSIRSF